MIFQKCRVCGRDGCRFRDSIPSGEADPPYVWDWFCDVHAAERRLVATNRLEEVKVPE